MRQAVADLLDRQAIATSVYNDTYTPLYSYIPEGLPGSGTQFQDMYGDGSGGPDPDRARTRLEDAGVEIPVSLSLQVQPRPLRQLLRRRVRRGEEPAGGRRAVRGSI